jgi:hypothetical protein
MSRVDDRRAWLHLALDERVYRQINFEGPATTFTVNLINELLRYGDIAPGKPALVALLAVLREQVGIDKQQAIDVLMAQFLDHY